MLHFGTRFTAIRPAAARIQRDSINTHCIQFADRSFAMKLHSTPTQQYQTVTAYDDDGVEFNAIRYAGSLLVLPETAPVPWPVDSFDTLAEAHFAHIASFEPDVVILGTGRRQRFVHPKLTGALISQRIGIECMDNQAACRTYNILMTEGRKVALALIFEPSSSPSPSHPPKDAA